MRNVGLWLSMPFVVLGVCLATLFISALLASLAGIRPDCVGGFFAAIAVVASAYKTAPSAKVIAACTAFALGAWIASGLLEVDTGEFTGRPLALGPMRSALAFTLLGGVLALGTVVFLHLRRRARARSADRGVN